MREIKFRAWDSYTNQWITKEGFHLFGEVTCFGIIESWLDKRPRFKEGERISVLIRFNDVITPQYTGLKDANGVEIYEGDIVKCKPDVDYLRHVVFEDGNYYLVNPDGKMPFPIQVVTSSHPETEVIGNIYENEDIILWQKK